MDDFDIKNDLEPTGAEQDTPACTEPIEVSAEPVASEAESFSAHEHTDPSPIEPQPAPYAQGSVYGQGSPYAQAPDTQPPYTQAPYTDRGYYQAPYQNNAYANPAPIKPKRKVNGGVIAFISIFGTLLLTFIIGFFCIIGAFMVRSSNNNFNYFDNLTPTAPHIEDSTRPETSETTLPTTAIPQTDGDNIYSSDNKITFTPLPSDKDDTDKYNTRSAYKAICDSTVGVVCYDKDTDSMESQGTGIIVSSDGYIVTNSHVIDDSRSKYNVRVVMSSNTTYDARIIGYDSRTDLAVLKVSADNLKPATFCDSDLVEIGQDVIAVGNPGGIKFQNSLTKGIVSALDRELTLSTQVSYIQTDAAINPGNSGGALCNIYGQVIGVTSAKLTSSTYEGVGFAIPSRTVKEVVDDLMSQGYVSGRVRIGIVGTELGGYDYQLGVSEGIIVTSIAKDGPCYNTELKVDDVITSIDGVKISYFSDVFKILQTHKEGDVITLGVYRPDTQKTLDIKITLMADNGESQQ